MKKIGIIMGSESDLPVMNEASKFLDEMNLSYDIDIVSAHRTPKKMFAYAENAVKIQFGANCGVFFEIRFSSKATSGYLFDAWI